MLTSKIIGRLIRLSPLIMLLTLCAGIALIDSSVFSARSLVQILIQSAPTAVLSLSVMVWLISGNMDMSAAFGTSFYVLVLGNALVSTESLVIAIMIMWLTAICVGLFNGIMVGIFQIPSFIVTLASMSILQGLILITASTGAIIIENPTLRALGAGTFLGIPNLLYYAAVVAFVVWAILKYTKFGANVYALGSNMNAARVSGVSIAQQQIKIFIFSAFFTSLASIMLAARVSLVSPNLGGTTMLLNSVAACIIGGTASTGGKGNVPGTLTGALIIGMINFLMTALGVSSTHVSMVQGLIIIAALTMDVFINRARAIIEKAI